MLNATAGVEPPPAEGRGYPNLATVPRPPSLAPAANRQAELDRLVASRDTSIREDQQIRALDPGRALPAPRPRAAPAARPAPVPSESLAPMPSEREGQAAQPEEHEEGPEQQRPESSPPTQAPQTPAPQAAMTMPRSQLPSSLFMGTVVAPDERGPLADFQRRVIEDSAAMAKRTNGRIRLVGGRSAEERQHVAEEFVRLGIPAQRISSAAEPSDATRPAIDVLVEN